MVTRSPLSLSEGMAPPKRRPEYLDLARIGESVDQLVQAVTGSFILHENGERLGTPVASMRFSRPSTDTFGSFDAAWNQVMGPHLPP
jgi:hypothetical protein